MAERRKKVCDPLVSWRFICYYCGKRALRRKNGAVVSQTRQLVAFSLDDQRYALELSAVRRTERMADITPLPQAPQVVHGLLNLRGEIVPVLNVRSRFRLPAREPRVADQLLIARTARRTVALLVDEVLGPIDMPPQEVIEPEAIVPGLAYLVGVVRLADGMLFIHDLDRFLSLEEEEALDAALRERDAD